MPVDKIAFESRIAGSVHKHVRGNTTITSSIIPRKAWVHNFTAFPYSISTCLASRLMLNIRSSHSHSSLHARSHLTHQPHPRNHNSPRVGEQFSGDYYMTTTSGSGAHFTSIIVDDAIGEGYEGVYNADGGGTTAQPAAPGPASDELQHSEDTRMRVSARMYHDAEWWGLKMVRSPSQDGYSVGIDGVRRGRYRAEYGSGAVAGIEERAEVAGSSSGGHGSSSRGHDGTSSSPLS